MGVLHSAGMVARLVHGIVIALAVAAILVVPAFALRNSSVPVAPGGAQQAGGDESVSKGQCHGIVRAYWRVVEKAGAESSEAAELAQAIDERGCPRGDGPPTDGPPWGRALGHSKDKDDSSGEAEGAVPGGWAWGRWKNATREELAAACVHVTARAAGHEAPGKSARAREKAAQKLGCTD